MKTNNKTIKSHSEISPKWVAGIVVFYVFVALLTDTLAAQGASWPIPWNLFDWDLRAIMPRFQHAPWGGFDLFKFVFWLVIPLAVCLPGMDWRYLLRGPWQRADLVLVGGLAIFGMAAMFLIPLIPALREIYPSMGRLPAEQKWLYVQHAMIWNLSWLPGWEFLHRYFLLKAVQREPLDRGRFLPGMRLSQWGWLLIPLSETLYHLQKPGLEALGMGALSVVITFWCLKRRNWLLGFLVHLIIEIELLIFMTQIA